MVTNTTLEAEISMPVLKGIDLSGSSDAEITGFDSSENFAVDLSGSSSLNGDIQAGDTTFDVSGSSDARLTGSGGNLKLDASGSSDVDLGGFPVVNADLDVSGASTVTVYPSGALNVKASGASDITYLGSPTSINSKTSGASSVEPR